MATVIYEYEIPDRSRPIEDRTQLSPSGVLVPFIPAQITSKQVVGKKVSAVSPIVGTYGMGGPGFFGLKLEDEWLVVAIWGAGEWILIDDRLVTDPFYEKHNRSRPWIANETDALTTHLVGQKIIAFDVDSNFLRIEFDGGASLEIDPGSERRPILEGSKEPREFEAGDDLRRAVFLSPTAEIWV